MVYMYAETAACSISLPIKTPEKVATVCTLWSIYKSSYFCSMTFCFLTILECFWWQEKREYYVVFYHGVVH